MQFMKFLRKDAWVGRLTGTFDIELHSQRHAPCGTNKFGPLRVTTKARAGDLLAYQAAGVM